MRATLIIAGIAIACFGGLAIWQLGGDDSDEAEPELAAPAETADPLPKLPRGWTKTVNPAGGFALGVPPGWSAKEAGATTTLTAPRGQVVVRVTADRSDEALEADLEEYANGIAERLAPGSPRPSISPPPVPRHLGYEAAEVTVVRGTKEGGEAVEIVVVRRPQLAAYPTVIARHRNVKPAELEPIVDRLVGSLRGRPVTLVG